MAQVEETGFFLSHFPSRTTYWNGMNNGDWDVDEGKGNYAHISFVDEMCASRKNMSVIDSLRILILFARKKKEIKKSCRRVIIMAMSNDAYDARDNFCE